MSQNTENDERAVRVQQLLEAEEHVARVYI